MTALRTTRSAPFLLGVAAVAAACAACGRGGPPEYGDFSRPAMRALPLPDVERIDYDPATRTLRLYHLPANGAWHVQTADAPDRVPVGERHVLPADADPDYTFVCYRRPTGQASNAVALADVIAARAANPSHAP